MQALSYRIEKKQEALKSCISYLTSGHNKTGCHMHDEELASDAEVFFFINGTGETLLINKFLIDIRVSGRGVSFCIFFSHYQVCQFILLVCTA